jgi:hypothetical protein
MNRRCRFGITLAALALHLLAPLSAYAAMRPTAGPGDYCSSALRSTLPPDDALPVASQRPSADPDLPAPGRDRHEHVHAHCASCLGATLAVAILAPVVALAIGPSGDYPIPTGRNDLVAASTVALLPPLRGPPSILL